MLLALTLRSRIRKLAQMLLLMEVERTLIESQETTVTPKSQIAHFSITQQAKVVEP